MTDRTAQDTYVVKVILGSLGAYTNFDNLVCRKRMVVEQNGVKFGPLGEYSVYTGHFRQLSA